ncbi:hypothetical protein RFI_15397 [Reticulomyxa filosa]|uniref:Uncharacterized protein n=1 Tax=Reticulomyxa filosa TaxID=46433 RepID=X6N6Z2_RETFI|nr:hypothetical protein RFI_15397 [Reticulomyxa filosa]|eukprot:ETO21806.1 hypothetical protein RFI_15397 [Reticulomyxa filosa]
MKVKTKDAICKCRFTLNFEKNVVILHEWHTNDDISLATSSKSVSGLYSAAAEEYRNLLKIKSAYFSKQIWYEFVSSYVHQSLHCTLAITPNRQNKQSHDQPYNLLCCQFTEVTTEQINYFKHVYLQDKDYSPSPTRILNAIKIFN